MGWKPREEPCVHPGGWALLPCGDLDAVSVEPTGAERPARLKPPRLLCQERVPADKTMLTPGGCALGT